MDHSPPPETNLRALGDHARVPFRYGARHSVASKPSWREGVTYLRRLGGAPDRRALAGLAGFALVGALGVVVNTGVLALLTRDMHTWYVTASILATQIAILSNFALTEWFVFRGVRTDKSLLFRFASYLLINNASLLISGPLLLLLVSALRMDVLLANALSLVLLSVGRFAIADSYIWGSKSLVPRAWRRHLRPLRGRTGPPVNRGRVSATSARVS